MTGCFICPIYDKGMDFKYGYNLVESAIQFGLISNLYFVFSSVDQKNIFLDYCVKHYGNTPNALILEQNLSSFRNPVTIKKFFGLRSLMSQYDYISTIDCESVFTQEFEPGHLLDEIWQSESYLSANICIKGVEILRKCVETLCIERGELLERETKNYRFYWWFNEIPVYRSDTLNDFFQWLENNGRIERIYNDWNCFDYLVYVLWILAFKEKHLHKHRFPAMYGIIEELWEPEIPFKHAIERKMHTHWTSRTKLRNKENNIYIQFHLDRRHTRFKQYLGRMKLRGRLVLEAIFERRG